jgi:sphingomyelin phosphodiesterase
VADAWGTRWLDSVAQDEFSRLGYYSTTPHLSGDTALRLVVLNTELFNHGNDYVVAGETVDEALAHLQWLNATLASVKAAGQRAYILGHVPLGMETAYGNDRRVPSVLRPYWMDLFARRYQDIVDSYGALPQLLYRFSARL